MVFHVREDVPIVTQLHTLRRMFSQFRQVAASDILDRAKRQRYLDLGVYAIAEGRHLVSMAKDNNLDIEMVELD